MLHARRRPGLRLPARPGAVTTGVDRPGPMANAPGDLGAVVRRAPVAPAICARRRDAGDLTAAEAAVVERVCARLPELAGPPEPPARLHGDLWSGNVLWAARRGRG